MQIKAFGHAVRHVRNVDRAEQFYHGILGLPVAARSDEVGMTFFTLGNHHNLAVRAVGDDAPAVDGMSGGDLFHVAFCIGATLDEL
jgi:catechol-2,3-dioxygenase